MTPRRAYENALRCSQRRRNWRRYKYWVRQINRRAKKDFFDLNALLG